MTIKRGQLGHVLCKCIVTHNTFIPKTLQELSKIMAMSPNKRLLLAAFLLLCFITMTASGKFRFMFTILYIVRKCYQIKINIVYMIWYSKSVIIYVMLLLVNILQPEVCERLRMMQLRRVLKLVSLSQTMKGYKTAMMSWIQWITHLQKGILQSIIEVPLFFSFVKKAPILFHSA